MPDVRTKDEVHKALGIIRAFKGGFLGTPEQRRISEDTHNNLIGVEAALEWMLGDDRGPLANTIADLEDQYDGKPSSDS